MFGVMKKTEKPLNNSTIDMNIHLDHVKHWPTSNRNISISIEFVVPNLMTEQAIQ